MNEKKAVRRAILGSNYLESDFEFKKAMLSCQFAMIGIMLSLFYLIADYSQGFTYTIWIYSGRSIFIFALPASFKYALHG